jgi:hypothetical protein
MRFRWGDSSLLFLMKPWWWSAIWNGRRRLTPGQGVVASSFELRLRTSALEDRIAFCRPSFNSQTPVQNVFDDATIFHSGDVAKLPQVFRGLNGKHAKYVCSGHDRTSLLVVSAHWSGKLLSWY